MSEAIPIDAFRTPHEGVPLRLLRERLILQGNEQYDILKEERWFDFRAKARARLIERYWSKPELTALFPELVTLIRARLMSLAVNAEQVAPQIAAENVVMAPVEAAERKRDAAARADAWAKEVARSPIH